MYSLRDQFFRAYTQRRKQETDTFVPKVWVATIRLPADGFYAKFDTKEF